MKHKRKAASFLLAALTALGLTTLPMLTANADPLAIKKIELGASGVNDKDFVYYGNNKNNDIKWRVLDANTDNTGAADGMFLLSEYLLELNGVQFDAQMRNAWQGSNAQNWCKQFVEGQNSAFTTAEQGALKSITKEDGEVRRYFSYWGASSLSNEKAFFLSAAEATDYLDSNNQSAALIATTSDATVGGWWLRSPSLEHSFYAGYTSKYGYVSFDYTVNSHPGARPACNLKLNSILFTSAAADGKSSRGVGAGALTPVLDYTATPVKEWKTTLLDKDRTFFAQAADNTVTSVEILYSNWSVEVDYRNAGTGENEYVSAMLCDADGHVLYYGTIAQSSASGTQIVSIPDGLAIGSYTLKVFSEQKNGQNKTDYASAFHDITLAVLPKAATPGSNPPAPSASFAATSENGGVLTSFTADMQYSVDGGNTWADVTASPMNITGVSAAYGLKVRNKLNVSDLQTIGVTQAAQPNGLQKTDCSFAANDGVISGFDGTMEYKVFGSADPWTVVAGATLTGLSNQTYLVRTKASGTFLASKPQRITIRFLALDYSALDAAIAAIPADLSAYTDVTVQAVNDARNAAENGKAAIDQKMIDGFAKAIQKAVDGLQKKTAVGMEESKTPPRTGDNGCMPIWWVMMMISISGLIAVAIANSKPLLSQKHCDSRG
ncbi:MAG: DUF6273 domain-containing protein [Eubacteriales bacterium]|nr:DUF6273 domain-containing protein [Eubacteriales bacterium]